MLLKTMDTNTIIKIIFMLVLAVVLIIVGPFLTIAALNTVFPSLAIPFNIWTWLSVLWLQSPLILSYRKKNND